jgi:hypothetical protein
MQAKHGSAVPFRSRGRLIGCCMALVFALSAVVFAPAAANAVTPPVTTYLALGDSISFGYSEKLFNENFPVLSPSYFEAGFDNTFARDVKAKVEGNKGLVIVNDACPGETSNGLVGENPALGGKAEAAYKPCAYHYVNQLPLHNGGYYNPETGKPVSQLEEALATLKEGAPAHPITGITLNIGGNDELAAITKCKAEVKQEFEEKGTSKYGTEPGAAITTCIVSGAEATFNHIIHNLQLTIGAIDSTGPGGGHYAGVIVLLGAYNPDSFLLPGSDGLQVFFNEKVEKEVVAAFPNVKFANPFPKFNPSPEQGPKEKKALEKYTEMFNAGDIAFNKATTEEANTDESEEGKTVIFPFSGEGDIHPSPLGYSTIGKLAFEAF